MERGRHQAHGLTFDLHREFAEPLARRLLGAHRPTMDRFGYLDALEVMSLAS